MTRSLACSRFRFATFTTSFTTSLLRAAGAAAVAFAAWLTPTNAQACGGDIDQPVVNPVISFPNQNAQTLLSAAANLELRATTLDAQASNFSQRASEANIDARAIRVQAATSESATERAQLLGLANQLSAQAAAEQQTAANFRRQSAALREQARLDRVQAAALRNGNGGGWRDRALPTSQARI